MEYAKTGVRDEVRAGQKYLVPLKNNLLYVAAAASVLCLTLILFRKSFSGNNDYPPLLFNLVIAWLPLVLSTTFLYLVRILPQKLLRPWVIDMAPIWLLFLPNAPYLLTDYVHIFANAAYHSYPLDHFLLWYDLILFFVYSFCGVFIWFLSVRHFQTVVTRRLNKRSGWWFVVGICLVTGFGIFLGRVLRLYTWDVMLNPLLLGRRLGRILTVECLSFTALFGFFLLAMYLVLHFLARKDPRN